MRPKVFGIELADVDAAGFAAGVTGDTFVLSETETSDGLGHRVSILNNTITDHSAKSVTLEGTDSDGKAIVETISAPGASSTVISNKYFKTLQGVTPSATIGADTFDIGWTDNVASKTIPLDYLSDNPATVGVYLYGVVDYTCQESFDDLQATIDASQKAAWFDVTELAAKTASLRSSLSLNATGVRLLINSYTNGARIQFALSQAGRR